MGMKSGPSPWQLSLGSAVLLLLWAGVLLGLNLHPRYEDISTQGSEPLSVTLAEAQHLNSRREKDIVYWHECHYGWPVGVIKIVRLVYAREHGWQPEGTIFATWLPDNSDPPLSGILLNLCLWASPIFIFLIQRYRRNASTPRGANGR